MKRVALLLVIFLFLPFCHNGYCDNLDAVKQLFYQANRDYGEERFEEAIYNYEEALKQGLESSHLYYNLGNAYFKIGSLGSAVLNYLRAQKLDPSDADLKSNLQYVRSLVRNRTLPVKQSWLLEGYMGVASSVDVNFMTLIVMCAYFLLSIFLIFVIISKKHRKKLIYTSCFVAVLFFVCLGLLTATLNETVFKKEAVVVSESAHVRFEPFDKATVHFSLYEGENIEIDSVKEEWVKVKRLDKKIGWLKASEIEFL